MGLSKSGTGIRGERKSVGVEMRRIGERRQSNMGWKELGVGAERDKFEQGVQMGIGKGRSGSGSADDRRGYGGVHEMHIIRKPHDAFMV